MFRFLMCFTLLLVGCPSQDVEENDSSTPTVEAPRGRIAGVVVSETGEPIDGADVRAQSQLTTTDETGSYVFDYVYPDRDIVIEFSKRGFAKNYTSTTLSSWETVTSNVTLLEIDGSGQFAGSTGGTVQVNDVIAEFPANAVNIKMPYSSEPVRNRDILSLNKYVRINNKTKFAVTKTRDE